MKVILFGATGMVGSSVLRECLEDRGIDAVLAIGRRASGLAHPKLRELVRGDLFDVNIDPGELTGYDACFFCLGVSSLGRSEAEYTRLTRDLTLGWARAIGAVNPAVRFLYVSGIGTGVSGPMWARVKGQTEQELLALLPGSAMIRLGALQPLHGERASTASGRLLLRLLAPLWPLLKLLWPAAIVTSVELGRAMILIADADDRRRVFDNAYLKALGRTGTLYRKAL